MQLSLFPDDFADISDLERIRGPREFDEAVLKRWGKEFIGVDEAGRGPLAGPVVAAAVILKRNHGIEDLRDSKKVGPEERESLCRTIRKQARAFSVTFVYPEEIEDLNILNAALLAMKKAVIRLKSHAPVIVDGNCRIPGIPHAQFPVVKGDDRSATVAAASILAKVARDRYMIGMHKKYPQYGFHEHKGYPTRAHLESLRAHGPCAIHRKTFQGVTA